MLVLALDLETSGLIPRDAVKGSASYPWPCQIGAVLFSDDGVEHALFGSRVKAEGRSIQSGAEAVHGISSRAAGKTGISEIAACAVVCGLAAQADILTGFNVSFDRDVIESALIRLGKETRMLVRPGLEVVDLIQPCAALCKLPSDHDSGSYKWPNLDRACMDVLGEAPRRGAHDALFDAQRAKRLFLELNRRGLLDIAAEAA